MSSLYKQYLEGNCEQVWQQIYQLEEKAFEPIHYQDVKAVLKETMQRSRYNLDLLYARLVEHGYEFQNKQQCRILPDADTDTHLYQLQEHVKPYGYVPLSLLEFYREVGSVDFTWSWEIEAYFPFNKVHTDAIFIAPLAEASAMAKDQFENYERNQYRLEVEEETEGLDLAPDDLHKDNVSGAGGYSIELTKSPSIDSAFPREEYTWYDTKFVEYLRLCFDWAGFPGLSGFEYPLPKFLSQTTKDLKRI